LHREGFLQEEPGIHDEEMMNEPERRNDIVQNIYREKIFTI